MSNELDFELIDDSSDQWEQAEVETNEEIDTSGDNPKKSDGDDTTPAKGKKSNWKKMSKINKGLKMENFELRKKLKQLEESQNKGDDLELFDDFDDEEETGFDKTEFRFFTIENPEAKEYKNQMESILDSYPDISFDDALALAKAKKPKQSQSSDDFNTKSVNTKVRKRLEDLTEEEALKLDGTKYLQYMRSKGKLK